MAGKYAHIAKNNNPDADSGGYKNVFLFAPRADFLALQQPVVADEALAAPGDYLKITTAHTFTAPKGFHQYACKTDSVVLKSTTVGEEGAKEMEWAAEFFIIGDSASTQEQLQRLLNDDVICLLKDADCASNQHVQLGNDCVSPKFSVEFDSQSTATGKKQYKVTVTCKKKYFYLGTVELAA